MVPPLSALSLALCHEVLEGGGNHKMETIKYAKRNFPSCSLRSQFTASQKPPLLFPNAKIMEPSKCSHQIRKKKLPLLLTPFAIHCLTKATAFVPQCENNGAIKMQPSNTQKETSPLAHSVRNSLPHKSHRFCSPMRK